MARQLLLLYIPSLTIAAWLYALALQGALHEPPTVESALIAAPLGMALVRGNILSLLKDR